MNKAELSQESLRPGIPRTVIALGFVSLFMDLSSEIIHALLPLFLTATLGASVAMVGMIDGIAEATAAISKIFSGYVSDRIGRRKPLILLGYGLAAITKPLFAVANGAGVVLGARFADRIGKGLRGAPRDALVADVTPPAIRGRAFGLRQAMDTVGAFLGPLIAIGLMMLLSNDMRAVFRIAAIPAILSALIVLVWVKEPPRPAGHAARPPLHWREIAHLERGYWPVVGIGVVFTLARFSEAFLVLRASDRGLPLALAPLVLVAMNAVYSLGAYPAGIISDRIPPRRLLQWGLVCLALADGLLAFGSGLVPIFAGIALWGGHMALTQGLLAKMVADQSSERLRGTAFGLFNLATGIAMLIASVAAGLLWDHLGPAATFIAGGALAVLTLILSAAVKGRT
ncbi:MFS transporter [Novosphingobium sp. KCTC 2891]|uniref:MFS transporter n=1 Tax=Novosphingobium sp. KCTC 2891 TaxID=2989730 RepID=UPI002221A6B3|nr:MFS transporter [Novosphingobium sp. KCTC 2891]MCW1381586.1 MFS transporter [Novosphingobium sp. KCTC 2891]